MACLPSGPGNLSSSESAMRESLNPAFSRFRPAPKSRLKVLAVDPSPFPAGPRQVWVAGGIGITPFLSAIGTGAAGDGGDIHLFYRVRGRDETLFPDEIRGIAGDAGSIHFHLLTSSTGARLTAETVPKPSTARAPAGATGSACRIR